MANQKSEEFSVVIKEIKEASRELTDAIKKDPQFAKDVALDINNNKTYLDVPGSDDLKETSYALYKEIDNKFESLTIEAISLDSAMYSGKIRSIITDTTNNPITMYLNEKGKLIKRKDGWKLLSGETSLSLTGK